MSDRWEIQYLNEYVLKFAKIALNCVKISAVYHYGRFSSKFQPKFTIQTEILEHNLGNIVISQD